jgi:CBS domain containing-hemolysin-like protein
MWSFTVDPCRAQAIRCGALAQSDGLWLIPLQAHGLSFTPLTLPHGFGDLLPAAFCIDLSTNILTLLQPLLFLLQLLKAP